MIRPRRIQLLAEDGPRARAWGAWLAGRGHAVEVARDAQEALLQPVADVLVADLGTRGVRALEAVEVLRRAGRLAPCVLIADEFDLELSRAALHLGALDLLQTPVAPHELAAAVEQILDARRAETVGRWRRVWDATPASVDRAAREVAAFALRCSLSPAARTRLATACGDLVENVVRHAYPGATGTVQVSTVVDTRRLTLTVRDEGVGFDVVDKGVDHMHDSRDGGLARVSALCEELRIESGPSGTTVRASFDVFRVLFDGEEPFDLSELDWLAPETTRSLLELLATPCDELPVQLSPALAVTVGRLLAGPDPRRVLQTALWS